MNKIFKYCFVSLLILFVPIQIFGGNDYVLLNSLKGLWRFSIGDNPDWAKPEFNDKDWDYLKVPGSWESQGYNDYDGYAWYRKSVTIEGLEKQNYVILDLGQIDDVDQVYFNGTLIAQTGGFFPDFQTAYNENREYIVPVTMINSSGKNVIAVRIYDSYSQGGIINGTPGIFVNSSNTKMIMDLSGYWDFTISHDQKTIKMNEMDWSKLFVPGKWEDSKYPNYDGYGWYWKKISLPTKLTSDPVYLVLGKIDDIDLVFIDGKKLGSVTDFKKEHSYIHEGQEYQVLRGYKIPSEYITKGQFEIVVRVYDNFKYGGIWAGPVGLMYESDYINLAEKYKIDQIDSFWRIIEDIFNL